MVLLGEILPELERFLACSGGQAQGTWRALQAVDAMVHAGRTPSDAVLLAALLKGMLRAGTRVGGRDAGLLIDEALRPIAERLIVPRRTRDRIRQILLAESRTEGMAAGKAGFLAQRDDYVDAVDLLEVSLRARGASDTEIARFRGSLQEPGRRGRRGRHAGRWPVRG
jgi:hypothetical protein